MWPVSLDSQILIIAVAISVGVQVSDWETHRQLGWHLYCHPSGPTRLHACLHSHVNTLHTCAPLYSAPEADVLQNAALQTWQQHARSILLVQSSLTSSQSSLVQRAVRMRCEVTADSVEERFLRGPHSLEDEKSLPVPHHHIMYLYTTVSCWLTGWFVVV